MLYARLSYQEGMPKLLKQGTVFNCHMKINFTISLTLFCWFEPFEYYSAIFWDLHILQGALMLQHEKSLVICG